MSVTAGHRHTCALALLEAGAAWRSCAADVASKWRHDTPKLRAGVEWSMADPWVFASLSYDGRVVINRVPSSIKYKILI